MNKVYILAPYEFWIVDRLTQEFTTDNPDIATTDIHQANVVWLFADWAWDKIPDHVLYSKKVITTVHHIVPDKFTPQERQIFKLRDRYTTVYHVPNKHTHDFIRPLTEKPIHVIGYWANQKIWKQTGERNELREKYNLPKTSYLVGSFQRDTEGRDLVSPKLEKGPDLLADYLENLSLQHNVHVVLAGWRRYYLMNRLTTANIPFSFFERPQLEVVNELYQTLDLYPVASRYEGGPQSLLECGLLNIPCVSRNIGIASEVLVESAINDDLQYATPAVPNVTKYELPHGYEPYRRLIQQL